MKQQSLKADSQTQTTEKWLTDLQLLKGTTWSKHSIISVSQHISIMFFLKILFYILFLFVVFPMVAMTLLLCVNHRGFTYSVIRIDQSGLSTCISARCRVCSNNTRGWTGRVLLFQAPERHEIRSRKLGLSNTSMRLKAYRTPKHSRAVYNTMRQDFTSCDDCQVNCRHTVFSCQS